MLEAVHESLITLLSDALKCLLGSFSPLSCIFKLLRCLLEPFFYTVQPRKYLKLIH